MMAVLQLSGFREWLSCCYSSLCPENVQATVVQQQEKRGTQNHWRTFCNSASHSQCLGFGFSAHESALWRGMPCFNENLTLSFPVGCCYCSRYPWRDRAAILGVHSFTMWNTVEEVGVFLASLPVQYALWKEWGYMCVNILQGEWKKWEGEHPQDPKSSWQSN